MQKINPKVRAAALAGSCTVLLVYGLSLIGVTLPPEVSSAITVVLAAAAGYLQPTGE
jgi:hypothetical protein